MDTIVQADEEVLFDNNFEFDISGFAAQGAALKPVEQIAKGTQSASQFVDDLISKYVEKSAKSEHFEAEEEVYEEEMDVTEADTKVCEIVIEDRLRDKDKRKGRKRKHREDGTNDEEVEKFQFNETLIKYKEVPSFIEMKISKPLLKALTELGLHKPTYIQAACIPVGLLNRDVCACARTGSGKTMAFLLPILERLVVKPVTRTVGGKSSSVTRALVLTPTRELALQIYQVAQQMVKFCPKIRIGIAAGGLDLASQEATLRLSPDIVIATPGRLIDHLCNAPSFHLRSIDFLVLDEADKMLDEDFTEQVVEVVRQCSPTRQTMLFSATMTENVKELATVSLRNPVKIFLDQNTDVALLLHQEFVRIRPHRESDREAMMVSLVLRSFPKRTIVFMPQKRLCHRVHVLLGLFGVKCAELHRDMTQAQRIESLKRFAEDCDVDVLLGTDLAARGLDIKNVQTVINYSLPSKMTQYVHRVGRTARAEKSGRAVSLVGEEDRKLFKQIVQQAPIPVKVRNIHANVIAQYKSRIAQLEPTIEEILSTELAEREAKSAEIQLAKANHLLATGDDGGDSGKRGGERKHQRVNWFAERKAEQKQAKVEQKAAEKAMRRKKTTPTTQLNKRKR